MTYAVLDVPDYNYSIVGPKTHSNYLSTLQYCGFVWRIQRLHPLTGFL